MAKAIKIVSLEDEAAKATDAEGNPVGVSFWFGEIGGIPFDDGTAYLAAKNRAVITDPKIIANLRLKAKQDNSYKIFEEPAEPETPEVPAPDQPTT